MDGTISWLRSSTVFFLFVGHKYTLIFTSAGIDEGFWVVFYGLFVGKHDTAKAL